jgi:outer membrane protein TolC
VSAVELSAQEIFDLKHCIETGLQRNYETRITRNEQSVSDNNFSVGNAGYLPTLDLTAGYSGTLNRERDKLQIDGTIAENDHVSNSALNAGIALNWTVFDGFGIQTNYKKLKELQQAGELNTRLTMENFIAELSAEYYNYVRQNIRLHNLQRALHLSRERLRIVEARYSIGSLSRLDLQQAKVDFNADSSRLMLQQETLFTSRTKLNRLMGIEEVENPLPVGDTAISVNALIDRETVWQETEKNNTALLLAVKQKRLSELELKATQSRNYPYLKLNAGYGFNQNRLELSDYQYQNTLGFNGGVTLGYNLFNGFKDRTLRRNAKVGIENKELEYNNLLLNIKSDFANMYMAYQNNIGLTRLEQENRQTAQENYEIAMERYKLGDLSGIELREAQNSLQEADERLVTAQYNTKICEVSLLQISGKLFELIDKN